MKVMLFTTPTCQHCGPAKELLVDIEGVEFINALEKQDLAEMYGVRSVPCLVVEKCTGTQSYVGLDKIARFVDEKGLSSDECGCNCGH